SLGDDLSGDLRDRTEALRGRSTAMRLFIPAVFAVTIVLAAALVQLTIERSVLVPLAKTQRDLARERDLLQLLMDHIPDCIYIKDIDSKFVRINKAHAAML